MCESLMKEEVLMSPGEGRRFAAKRETETPRRLRKHPQTPRRK